MRAASALGPKTGMPTCEELLAMKMKEGRRALTFAEVALYAVDERLLWARHDEVNLPFTVSRPPARLHACTPLLSHPVVNGPRNDLCKAA
jgi:hypothetical protein